MVSSTPTFGRYVLGPRIAQGGMGEVFLATQTGMGAFAKPLVLKLMLPHLAKRQRAIEMFLAEARLASRMNHPNVVQIFDVGVIDGRYFIAMELVRGVSLSRLVSVLKSTGTPLGLDLVLYVARCLCDALHHAHEQRGADGKPLNLIHQDVTLENVLVGTEGQVKLTDFGIARAAQAPELNLVAGKQGYIAPERTQGVEPDRRADVYSAAVTIASLASLERPDERGGAPLPGAFGAHVPQALVEALRIATSEDPSQRFESARKLRDALPPMSSTDSAEELGALISKVCAQQVTQLDGDVQRTAAFSRATATAGTDAVVSAPARKSKAWMVGVGVAVAAAVTFFALPSPPELPLPPQAKALGGDGVGGKTGSGRGVDDLPDAAVEVTSSPRPSPPPEERESVVVDAGVEVVAEAPPPKKPVGKKKSPPAETGTGVLTIDATPWAMVSINGKPIGETPIGRYTVGAGTVVIDFVNPETGAKGRRTVVVKPGATLAVNETLR